MDLKGRSLLTLKDFSADEIRYLLDVAIEVKKDRRAGRRTQRLVGLTLAMIFEKRSTLQGDHRGHGSSSGADVRCHRVSRIQTEHRPGPG